MAQKTIGIEVGSRKLKAVELESRFGELTILNYWISDLPEEFRDKLFALKAPERATKNRKRARGSPGIKRAGKGARAD